MVCRNRLMTTGFWDRETFVENLRAVGARAYHDKHPFHVAMNEGRLSPEALRGWVANRFYYQRNIPLKDAAILSNCPVREVRRIWIHRILDHDGVLPKTVESAEDSAHYSACAGARRRHRSMAAPGRGVRAVARRAHGRSAYRTRSAFRRRRVREFRS